MTPRPMPETFRRMLVAEWQGIARFKLAAGDGDAATRIYRYVGTLMAMPAWRIERDADRLAATVRAAMREVATQGRV